MLFPASGPLDFAAMDILGLLLTTTQANQYVLVLANQYSKVMQAILMSNVNATHITNLFLDHRIIPFGTSTYLLADNGPQFVSNFFAFVCGYLGVNYFTTTDYHPHTNGQAVQFH